jgi:hypothetical protein
LFVLKKTGVRFEKNGLFSLLEKRIVRFKKNGVRFEKNGLFSLLKKRIGRY